MANRQERHGTGRTSLSSRRTGLVRRLGILKRQFCQLRDVILVKISAAFCV